MNGISVLVVNDFGHVNGGASQVALGSAIGLARAGYDVRLFVGVGPIAAEIEEAGIPAVSTDQREIATDPSRARAALQGIWNHKAAAALRTLLNQLDYRSTVVHVHSWTKALSSSVIRECMSAGFPVTCTLHDYFVVCPNGGLFDYQKREICALRPMSLECMATHCDSRRYSHKLWRVARQIAQNSVGHMISGIDDFVVISKFSKALLESYLPGSKRLHLVPNPVSAGPEDRVRVEANEHVLFVGRLSEEKGPLVFARAAARLGMRPVFVGDGPLRSEILHACPDAVITGWLETAQVEAYLRSARALVYPTLLYETHGLAVMEALARGIPAVVSGGSAAAELVVPGETGYCFRRGDDEDLAEMLQRLSDPGSVERMGRKAYEAYWKAPLTMTNHVAALGTIYKGMLRSTRTRQSIPS